MKTKTVIFISIFLLICVYTTTIVSAQKTPLSDKTIIIGTFSAAIWNEAISTDSKSSNRVKYRGLGSDIIEEIVHRLQLIGLKSKLVIYPIKRLVLLFNRGEIDTITPYVLTTHHDLERYFSTSFKTVHPATIPIWASGQVIFSLKNQPKIDHIQQLEGKTVGTVIGYALPIEVEKNKKIIKEPVKTGLQNFKKLARGRIDAIVSFKVNGFLEAYQAGLSDVIHYGNEFNYSYAGFFMQNNQQGILLTHIFNIIIMNMVKDGIYQQIYQKYPHYQSSILP